MQLKAEHPGQVFPHQKGVLGRGPDSDSLVGIVGDDGMGLHGVVVDHGKSKGVFEYVVSLGEGVFHVSPLVAALVAQVGFVDPCPDAR